jgi:hypothetical protein
VSCVKHKTKVIQKSKKSGPGKGNVFIDISNSHSPGDAPSDERLADGEYLVAGALDILMRALGLLRQVDDGGDCCVAPGLAHHVLRRHLSPPDHRRGEGWRRRTS